MPISRPPIGICRRHRPDRPPRQLNGHEFDQRAAQRPSAANLPPDEAAYAFQPASESPEFSLEDNLLMFLQLGGWALV
jgi:hypothetical protein